MPDHSPPNMNRQHDSPDKSIKDNSGQIGQGGNAEIHDRTGLYLAVIALIIATLALGIVLNRGSNDDKNEHLRDQLIDAKIGQGAAETRAALQAQIAADIAKASEEAHGANVRSQLTERDLSILREALRRKGIALPPKD